MGSRLARIISALLCIALIGLWTMPIAVASDVPLKEKFGFGSAEEEPPEYYSSMKYPYYTEILHEYENKGYESAEGSPIVVAVDNLKLPDGKAPELVSGVEGNKDLALIWDDTMPWVEWEVEIPKEGLYELELEYCMLKGSGNPAVRSIYIDGEIPFLEANNIVFHRIWRDEGEPIVNSLGDEVRPGQVEVRDWRNKEIWDGQGFYPEPLKFYFTPGRHTIRLEYIDQPMAIGNFTVRPAKTIPTYEQVRAEYRKKGYKEAKGSYDFQAENEAIEKSDPTVRRENHGDPLCVPSSPTDRKLNVIGGWRWRRGNQSITWKFTVPEDGLYKIGLRVGQWWNDGLPSFRQIAIDGQVPFKELEAYEFAYDKKWRTHTLKDSSGEPYLFYLTEGEHTITMTVKMGYLSSIIQSINEDSLLLSGIIRDIVKITGSDPDPNYDYELMSVIPTLQEDMETLIDSLQAKYDVLSTTSSKVPAMANNFLTIKKQLESMIKDPFTIARRMNDLNNAQTTLGAWYLDLQNQPLMIDYFLIGSPDTKWQDKQSNVLQRTKATFDNFKMSFKKDYDNIGSVIEDDTQVKEVINVWIARGTEWAEVMKEMADKNFTPDTGIMVNMNVLPASQLQAGTANALMLSITSGRAPDVAMGVASNSPVEFAIRDAAYDISQFEDFEQVAERFLPNIFIPYRYMDGIYALPETMDFTAMFYRKDIVDELGIRLPETREDLYNHVLPILYQNGLEFNYPANFAEFIYQHGAEYYIDDGMKSGLGTPEAYRAFKECSELYTNYAIPVVASFFNRMRTGEMPLGIGNYSLYMQLSVAAPELAGRWGIAPIPGTERADGTIDRSNGVLSGECDIIMNQTEKADEAWEFLKWWTSAPVQTEFAREIESLVGAEARWNTANVEAFTNLAWGKDDLAVIEEHWNWGRGIPVVLGGYFTDRHLNNAWNRVVVSGQGVRDALEEAVEAIDRELRMKQEEYGISDR